MLSKPTPEEPRRGAGYADNNRTKQVVRWKATGQHLSPEAKADLAAQAERDLYEATAARLVEELRINNSGVKQTQYHKAKQIEATPGAPTRNGDVLVPGYDVEGKLWTIQYIKEDGTKRFAKDSRKHGCFHVVGMPNSAAALQEIAVSPVVVNCGRLRNRGHDREAGKSGGVSRIRLRESPCGRDIHPRALARESDHHCRR